MTTLVRRIRQHIERHALWAPGARVVAALSGGSDSVAQLCLLRDLEAEGLLVLAGAAHLHHGLRPSASSEQAFCRELCDRLSVPFVTEQARVRDLAAEWRCSVEVAARRARYAFLERARVALAAERIAVAHTLDDQAETVLIRLTRGSGLSGLAAMARQTEIAGVTVVRPLLGVSKARLVATLRVARVPYADDPSNRDPRFTRVRMRDLMPALAGEGLSAQRLSLLGRRIRRADEALETAVDRAAAELAPAPWPDRGPIIFPAARFAALPCEVGLRLLGRAIGQTGDEGPVELGKLEALHASLVDARDSLRFRRTLAGAQVTLARDLLTVERAPRRRAGAAKRP
jgi:tRNA(Ile)-lysidine synthase